MLERYFTKPATVDRVRACWLGEQIEAYVQHLDELGHGPALVRVRVPLLCQFAERSAQSSVHALVDLPGQLDRFIEERMARSAPLRSRSAERLRQYENEIRGPLEHFLAQFLLLLRHDEKAYDATYPIAPPPARMPASAAHRRRFDAYLDELHAALGDRRRHEHFDAYCRGLNLDLERKSVEPIAAAIDPHHVCARHQSLLHFVAEAPWSDRALLDRVVSLLDEAMGESTRYWLVDDTGVPKKGKHSVGVGRQYCGQVGKSENCQVAVSLSLASEKASVPMAHRLYLPERWTSDAERLKTAGVPEGIEFATKPAIALEQARAALERGVRPATLVADAGYGDVTSFRDGLEELGLSYSVGVKPLTSVWAPGVEPLPPKPWSGRGRRPTNMSLAPGHEPTTLEALARSLPARKWRTVNWREGTNARLCGRFARVRVRAAHGDAQRAEPRPEQWLIIEWPDGEKAPSGYFLSTEPASTTLAGLVGTIKVRWRIERDYQELKSEFGLGHYEGRGWRGFHHHASLCIATYAFHTLERLAGRSKKKDTARPTPPAVPEGWAPRGAPGANATSRA